MFRDRSLFIAWGGSRGILGGGEDHLIFRRTEGGSVVTESPKGVITEHFGRIQRGDHSNLLGQCQFESIQNKSAHSFYWEMIAFAVSICSNTTLFKNQNSVILANVHISIHRIRFVF